MANALPTDGAANLMNEWVAREGAKLDERYELEAQIGEGGMGQVWRARHLALESKVAIKFLSGSLASNEETRKRFLVEAKITAQLRTRHAVQVFDFGVTEDGQPYLVMELLDGETLARRIERLGTLDPAMTVRLLQSAAKALARAHGLGIVHRDFKPDNVFLTQNEEHEDEVKVVDFGIAKLIGSLEVSPTLRPPATNAPDPSRGLSSLTRTGKMVGTPHYMSPEQVQSAEIGPAADIWAFGVVAYQCLTGRTPFGGSNVTSVLLAVQMGSAPPARSYKADVPAAFDAWFHCACAVDPAVRFGDAQLAATALGDALLPGSPRGPTRSMDSSGELEEPAIRGRAAEEQASGGAYAKPALSTSSLDAAHLSRRGRVALGMGAAAVVLALGAGVAFVPRLISRSISPGRAVATAVPPAPASSGIAPVSMPSAEPPSSVATHSLPPNPSLTGASGVDPTPIPAVAFRDAGHTVGQRPPPHDAAGTARRTTAGPSSPAQPPPPPAASRSAAPSPFTLPPLGI